MDYMARHGARRARPAELVPGTIRVISARLDYLPRQARDAGAVLAAPGRAYIARYALGRDYHRVLRQKLKRLARRIEGRSGRVPLPRLHRQRAGARGGACRQGGPGLARQAHAAAHPACRLVLFPGRNLHRSAAAGRHRGARALRQLPRMPRRLSDRRHRRRRTSSTRGAASPISPSSSRAAFPKRCGR